MDIIMIKRAIICLIALLLGLCGIAIDLSGMEPAAAPDDSADIQAIAVRGTNFEVTLKNGRLLSGSDLTGAVLTLDDGQGGNYSVRIDAVEPDPKDSRGELLLYTLSTLDAATGEWRSLCSPDVEGVAKGFPIEGRWTASGEHRLADGAFVITCTAGAIGKCVRFGYHPWRTAADGASLWDHHQACVRMARADYCGDGQGRTRNGTPINLYDRIGIQRPDPVPDMRFEAAWTKNGAACVHKTRLADVYSLESLAVECPRLQNQLGDACRAEVATSEALLFNQSYP